MRNDIKRNNTVEIVHQDQREIDKILDHNHSPDKCLVESFTR